MRYFVLFIAILFFFCKPLFADTDSLQNLLDAAPTDSVRTHILLKEANRYEGVDYEKCKAFALRAKELAEKAGYYRGMGSSLISLGRISMQMGKDKDAVEYFFQAIRLCEKHDMPIGLANAHRQLSAVYQGQKGKLQTAYEYMLKALEIDEKIEFKDGLYQDYFRLQQVTAIMGRYEESLDYAARALTMVPDETSEHTLYINMGYGYKDMKRYDEALEYADKALVFFNKEEDNYARGAIFRLKALAYIAKKDFVTAEKYINEAIKKYEEAGALIDLPEFYNDIAKMYKEKGDYREAAGWFEKTQAMKDSLHSVESSRQMAEMEAKYQAGVKEQKIREQKAAILYEKQMRNSMIAIAVLVLLVAGALYFNMRRVRKLNKELVELHAVKNKLFSIVSHDLRSPLNTLQNLLVLFKEADLVPEKRQAYTEKLQRTLQNTSQLLDNLLHWSATQMSSIQPRKEKVNIRSLAEESFDLVKEQAEHKRIILENKITPAAMALADENMVRVVFRNLVSNSLKFTPEGGRVTISDAAANGYVRISVKDTGVGMDEMTKTTILESARVLSRQGTANEKGFGIGLQLCREYVEKNGGSLSVESTAGEGTTFHFTLAGTVPA